ncbi:MAG: hypothetical protein GF401_04175 [Chitinivibrionales bacterium]|nr:hypothetical protein [Chitinivibrionales bacterium]
MANCIVCGKELWQGQVKYCPRCAREKNTPGTGDVVLDNLFALALKLGIRHIILPLAPCIAILWSIAFLVEKINAATGSVVLGALIMWAAYIVASIPLGYMFIKALPSGFFKTYWTKPFPYYNAFMYFMVFIIFKNINDGIQESPVSGGAAALIILALPLYLPVRSLPYGA